MALTMVGCGSPAAPEPPSLNLPTPILNLSAVRIGDSVHLTWTMPQRTTDHLALKHPVTVQICRAVESGPCSVVAGFNLPPGAAGAYTDTLPSDLRRSPDRLLRYEVAARNHAGKSAGSSNAAYSAAGPAPAVVTGLTGLVRSEGVVLSWKPVPEGSVFFRIERQWLSAPESEGGSRSPLSSPAPPAIQTLAVHPADGSDPSHAIDKSALFNQKYRYVVERIATPAFSGRTVEVQGPPSEAIEVVTTDKFPPAVPRGLVAVADAAGRAIDLSWSPDTESDLAGYRVYRRDVRGNLLAQRVASLEMGTSYRDTRVEPDHTYAYSVSAIDQSGNESRPSPEVEETLPHP